MQDDQELHAGEIIIDQEMGRKLTYSIANQSDDLVEFIARRDPTVSDLQKDEQLVRYLRAKGESFKKWFSKEKVCFRILK